MKPTQLRGIVLVADAARPTHGRLSAALEHHAYRVTVLTDASPQAIRAAVAVEGAECVLLDGPDALGGATAWGEPSWMRDRGRAVPVVMFAGRPDDLLAAVTDAAAARSSV